MGSPRYLSFELAFCLLLWSLAIVASFRMGGSIASAVDHLLGGRNVVDRQEKWQSQSRQQQLQTPQKNRQQIYYMFHDGYLRKRRRTRRKDIVRFLNSQYT